MHPLRRRRLQFAVLLLCTLALSLVLTLRAMRHHIQLYLTPTQYVAQMSKPPGRFRMGGMVASGSVRHEGAVHYFKITDFHESIPVRFEGLLPDLFREGQGVVIEGKASGDKIIASEVLAKHDERYMPREVAVMLEAKKIKRGEGP